MKKALHMRVLAMLCLLAVLVCAMPAQPVMAETLKEKIERLKGELEDIEDSITQLEGSKDTYAQQKEENARLMAVYQEYLEASRQSIEQTSADIEVKQGEIAAARQVIYENEQLFQERLVAIYKMNTASPLTTLLSVNTFSELLTVSGNLQVLTQHDTELLEKLAAERAGLEADLVQLDQLLADYNGEYDQYLLDVDTYRYKMENAQANFEWAQSELANKEALQEETYEELERAQEEMKKVQAALSTQGTTSWDGSTWENGTLTWPVPGFYNVSCEFGSADPNGAAHRGMDINGGGIAGQNVVAGDDGTVLVATYGHYSYGNYVVIDHGAGIKSLYAHCEALYISVGDTVSRGDPIASVGTTGFSTGYHLHFEVHQDGVLQNPRNYLSA